MRASKSPGSISGDLSGAVADLGVLVPLSAALVLVNGLDPAPMLIGAGVLSIAAGLIFKIPFPVQPLKALTALAVAQQLAPEVIHAAGLEIGVLFVVLSVTRVADRLAGLFTRSVIRSLQFGVGTLLVISAIKLVMQPPEIFRASPGTAWLVVLTVAALAAVAIASRYRWNSMAVVILAGGILVGWIVAAPELGAVAITAPSLAVPPLSQFGTAFVILVIPQVPLTYGNAVVGVSDLARETFGERAERVTPGAVALSCGLGNVAAALIGGMPMCHGSSGLSAHVRLGARSSAMNVLLGSTLIVSGLVFSNQILELFGLLPVWALGGFLAYAGIRHALLILDLRGKRLALALAAGLLGVLTGNLAYTTGLALLIEHGPRVVRSLRRRRGASTPVGS
jgi:MFS superfamily sulfate permease-like transporter